MIKKVLAAIAVIILTGLIFLFVSKNFSKVEYSNQMINGTVKEIKNSSIVVEGVVKSTDLDKPLTEKRIIEFIITNDTVFKNSTLVFTQKQLDSGQPFHPETKFLAGKVADLKAGLSLTKIQSQENLFTVNKAIATGIDYIIYDYP